MSVKDIKFYISDIVSSINYIEEFTGKISFIEFEKDIKTQYAVIRCFEVIGEASKKIPDDYKDQNLQIPWKVMAGMRDRLIHGYDTVDPSILWRTIQKDIPELKINLQKIL